MEALGELSGVDLARALGAYRQVLRLHQDVINRLNVYPVPDGDTGTNMALTVESVVAELAELDGLGDLGGEDFDPRAGAVTGQLKGPDMVAVCKAIAHGSLMGARGNSGVILSQLLRGCTGCWPLPPTPVRPTWPRLWARPARPPARPFCVRWKGPS